MWHLVRTFIHDPVDGSWFGFPNYKWMGKDEFRFELSFTLFCYSAVFMLVGFAILFSCFWLFSVTLTEVSIGFFGVSVVTGLASMFIN